MYASISTPTSLAEILTIFLLETPGVRFSTNVTGRHEAFTRLYSHRLLLESIALPRMETCSISTRQCRIEFRYEAEDLTGEEIGFAGEIEEKGISKEIVTS